MSTQNSINPFAKNYKLSKDILEKIRYASELGDVATLSDQIALVSQSDAELAEVLSDYADKYEFEEIQKMLSQPGQGQKKEYFIEIGLHYYIERFESACTERFVRAGSRILYMKKYGLS